MQSLGGWAHLGPSVMASRYSKVRTCWEGRKEGDGRLLRETASEWEWVEEGGRQSETSELIPHRRTDCGSGAGKAAATSPLRLSLVSLFSFLPARFHSSSSPLPASSRVRAGVRVFLGGLFFWIEEGEWSCRRAHRHFSEARQVKVRCETRVWLYFILLNSRLHLELILPECENRTSRGERGFFLSFSRTDGGDGANDVLLLLPLLLLCIKQLQRNPPQLAVALKKKNLKKVWEHQK